MWLFGTDRLAGEIRAGLNADISARQHTSNLAGSSSTYPWLQAAAAAAACVTNQMANSVYNPSMVQQHPPPTSGLNQSSPYYNFNVINLAAAASSSTSGAGPANNSANRPRARRGNLNLFCFFHFLNWIKFEFDLFIWQEWWDEQCFPNCNAAAWNAVSKFRNTFPSRNAKNWPRNWASRILR